MLAIFMGLVGSFWFAVSMILINRGVLAIDFFCGLLVNLGVNALFLWIYVSLSAAPLDIGAPANLIFVMVGIFVPGVSRFFIFKGMQRLGASISSCLTNSTPLFAILFAIFFLGERPTLTNLLGALSIVTGVVSLSWRGAAKTWRSRDLLFPLTAAFLFAGRDNLVRVGVLQIHAPVVGAAIASIVSFMTMALIFSFYGEKKSLPPSARRGLFLFAASGFMNFLSYVFIYTALSMERVSLVSPVVNCSSLFVVPLSLIFLQDVEKLTSRKIAAIALVVVGVFLISWEKL
ncbi:MAG: DMT family transporter [Candidatus Binatia bacterium]